MQLAQAQPWHGNRDLCARAHVPSLCLLQDSRSAESMCSSAVWHEFKAPAPDGSVHTQLCHLSTRNMVDPSGGLQSRSRAYRFRSEAPLRGVLPGTAYAPSRPHVHSTELQEKVCRPPPLNHKLGRAQATGPERSCQPLRWPAMWPAYQCQARAQHKARLWDAVLVRLAVCSMILTLALAPSACSRRGWQRPGQACCSLTGWQTRRRRRASSAAA